MNFTNKSDFETLFPAIPIQVQKVIQSLESSDEAQEGQAQCKLEPNLSISPKMETIEVIVSNF